MRNGLIDWIAVRLSSANRYVDRSLNDISPNLNFARDLRGLLYRRKQMYRCTYSDSGLTRSLRALTPEMRCSNFTFLPFLFFPNQIVSYPYRLTMVGKIGDESECSSAVLPCFPRPRVPHRGRSRFSPDCTISSLLTRLGSWCSSWDQHQVRS